MHFYEYIHNFFSYPLIALFFLAGLITLSIVQNTFITQGKYQSKLLISSKKNPLFFFRKIFIPFFAKDLWKHLLFYLNLSKQITVIGFVFSLAAMAHLHYVTDPESWYPLIFLVGGFLVLFLLDIFTYFLSSPKAFTLTSFIASLYLSLYFPLIGPFLRISHIMRSKRKDKQTRMTKTEIKEYLRDIFTHDLPLSLDTQDLKRVASLITFKERVAKEVMVPRIDVSALSSDTSLAKAAELFEEENYSRIPVYKENLDHILGVLHYKDLLKIYIEKKDFHRAPLESLLKPVIFTPENKKITSLLQEFKSKQVHMAIVVDEYGGTEGIVTIEDVLEELVGEIEDEYDQDDEEQFWKLPNGEWIVDSKMSIIDIESKLNIHLPEHADYETIGGYIYHKTGTIPQKGWTIHLDEYTLEVLSCSERSIEKIRIIPLKK